MWLGPARSVAWAPCCGGSAAHGHRPNAPMPTVRPADHRSGASLTAVAWEAFNRPHASMGDPVMADEEPSAGQRSTIRLACRPSASKGRIPVGPLSD
jgi:hypothetical protein